MKKKKQAGGLTPTSNFFCVDDDYDELDSDEYDDDDDIEFGERERIRTVPSYRSDRDLYDHQQRHLLTVANDDRPITPLKDRMVYDVANSSLDFKDGRNIYLTLSVHFGSSNITDRFHSLKYE